jgi:hypothetical protein
MHDLAELKVNVARMEMHVVNTSTSGVTRGRIVLMRRSEEVITDRLVVTDEAVRTLNLGK